MKFYHAPFSRETWTAFLESDRNVYGVPTDVPKSRSEFSKLVPFDRLVVYITGEKLIAGILKITSRPFDAEEDGLWGGKYLYRVNVQPMFLCEIPILEFEQLSIFREGNHWQMFVRKSLRPWSRRDYLILEQKIKSSTVSLL